MQKNLETELNVFFIIKYLDCTVYTHINSDFFFFRKLCAKVSMTWSRFMVQSLGTPALQICLDPKSLFFHVMVILTNTFSFT